MATDSKRKICIGQVIDGNHVFLQRQQHQYSVLDDTYEPTFDIEEATDFRFVETAESVLKAIREDDRYRESCLYLPESKRIQGWKVTVAEIRWDFTEL